MRLFPAPNVVGFSFVETVRVGWLQQVLIWFAAGAVVITFVIFRSPNLDYRLVALGAVLPSIEVPFGTGVLHTLVAPTLVLVVVMAATSKRRMIRRQWLSLPIGMYLHLVLDLAAPDSFWWPVRAFNLYTERSPEVARGVWSLLLEIIGIGLAAWAYRRFGLDDSKRLEKFLRSGQLDRAIMEPGSPNG